MSTGATIDRRILKAFYTQYVAVLLILLVFSVGVVAQRGVVRGDYSSKSVAKAPIKVIGSIKCAEVFSNAASPEIVNSQDLAAVVETLLNHDLRGVFTLYIPVGGNAHDTSLSALARVKLLREYLNGLGVPEEAYRFALITSVEASSEVAVAFESPEVSDA